MSEEQGAPSGRRGSIISRMRSGSAGRRESRRPSLLRRASLRLPFFSADSFAALPEPTEDLLLEPLVTGQSVDVGEGPEGSVARVRSLVEEDGLEDKLVKSPPLFCELLELSGDCAVWNEKARWIKYEEEVEEGGTRWSKPHVTLPHLPSLLQLKNILGKGGVELDWEVGEWEVVAKTLTEGWRKRHGLGELETAVVRGLLSAPKHHLVKNRLQTIRGAGGGASVTNLLRKASTISTPEIQDETTDHEPSGKHSPGVKPNTHLYKKLASDSESVVILAGKSSRLSRPLTAFVRLKTAADLHPELPELPVPVRCVLVLLLPTEHYVGEITALGKAAGVLFSDAVFSRVALAAGSGSELADGVDEFMASAALIPPAKWPKGARFEPPEGLPLPDRIVGQLEMEEEEEGQPKWYDAHAHVHHPLAGPVPTDHSDIARTGRLFGGLCQDVRRKARWYASDFTDVFRGRITQVLAATIFLFFANVTKIITFGGVMGNMLQGQMGTVENLLSGGICGVVYGLFAGQPICVLSATGPTLVFEFIMFDFCKEMGWGFLEMRFWVGMWTAVFLIIIVATDASVVVTLITRFTEEAFATLISIIFIIQAFEKVFDIAKHAPITIEPQRLLNAGPCVCNITSTSEVLLNLTGQECEKRGGVGETLSCQFLPDVFLFSFLLVLGTFVIAIGLKFFRHSGFLPGKVRNVISDFNVLIAIVAMSALSFGIGLEVPGLKIPDKFRPTLDRPWLVSPMKGLQWWVPLAAALPALFFTILVFMDQHITAVIINRKDNRLRKGAGYHLDLMVIAALMLVCSSVGIPFYVAATVISIIHLDALRVSSSVAAPGEKPQFLGVNEQRITSVLAHVLIGLSVVMTPVVKLVPMPVLLGVFLYMGVVSLIGQQFVQRLSILFMPAKHQPDHPWLRKVRLPRVHLFTAIQILALVALFVVKYIKMISMVFPLMLIIMVWMRMVMSKVFTAAELAALDDPLPSIRDVFRVRSKRVEDLNGRELEPRNDGEALLIAATPKADIA